MEFVRDNPGEPVPEETFTHYTHHGHQSSLSAFSIYYDTWHPLYSIHVLYSLFPQSLKANKPSISRDSGCMCLQVDRCHAVDENRGALQMLPFSAQ